MRIILLFLVATTVLTACNNRNRNQIAFDGQFFNARATKVDKVRENFAVTVRPVSNSLTGALEAGRHAATRYCILEFGSSAIDWTLGPDQDPESYVITNDQLDLSGTCTP